ncbi:MAG: hypothetical protein J0I47_01310 [Sphingomonas sp.]|uniref:hypothetical protein n=1 Tax=Sphingomonas sp. TaxID=28214 RepID=UPI001ACAEC64|nr:hypothetical protein [Sphingomonas sp.]MBN8806867.1 hypothetical protein [Sphingomonas sp.]
MIAALALALALALASAALPDQGQTDFDAYAKAVEKCDRKVVAETVSESVARHSRFLIDAYKEQRAIAVARLDIADRRRKLHAGERTPDTEAALSLLGETLDDRQHALDDQRRLDQMEQDMVSYFRSQYLTRCAGRGS